MEEYNRNSQGSKAVGDGTIRRRNFSLYNRFFHSDVIRVMDWIVSDIRELGQSRWHAIPATATAATAVDIQVLKRVIFYLEHFILSQRNSALFRAKCERDFHRVILLSKLLRVAVAAVQTVLE